MPWFQKSELKLDKVPKLNWEKTMFTIQPIGQEHRPEWREKQMRSVLSIWVGKVNDGSKRYDGFQAYQGW